jgi:hypothetical protein
VLDPNIIYAVLDVNGDNEITINVNESIRLYIDLTTIADSNVTLFRVEADISNTSLGYIDNTEYPSGTAMLHTDPHTTVFSYWGSGIEQSEGIQFLADTDGNPIDDGHLASFVYTALDQGDVVLNLVNWNSRNTNYEAVFPTLESILIHQIDPAAQQMMSTSSATEATSASPQEEPIQQIDTDELADQLEDFWPEDEELREIYTKKEWDEFADFVRE